MITWLHVYSVFAFGTMVLLLVYPCSTVGNDTSTQIFNRNCRIISFAIAVSIIIVQTIIYNIH